ncbi:MAG: AMP-binding protein [Alphaproteobacteria bacterium]
MHGNSRVKSNDKQLNAADYSKHLLSALLKARNTFGKNTVIAADITSDGMSYQDMFTRAFILKRKLEPVIGTEKNVALLLPNSLGVILTFVSLHMLRRVPCMLNFSAGEASILHACTISAVQTVITSRVFIEKAKLEHIIKALQKHYTIIYLEDVRKNVDWKDKLSGALDALLPEIALRSALSGGSPDEAAVVLYTSGSEGVPKGVALSHANLLSNIAQACAKLDLSPPHIIFNALPVFHSFGLTVGTIMPLICGLKTYLYPSPVQYKQIPEEVYKSEATIMLGTDTFFQGYARYAEKHHFSRIRLAVAGAEKLKESTRKAWIEQFGVDILQGYGVTEASPVISVNTHEEHKPGTVGKLFPAMEYKLEAVDGLEKGARLLVKGPNVMLGYLKADKPGVVQPQGAWYDTGDIVDISEDGYITILGRAKRFAKIAGEMVSLTVVEELAYDIDPEKGHAAITIPDDKRGEQIVMYTESPEITKDKLLKRAQEKGVPEICLPKQIQRIDLIPKLGSGKVDYISLKNSMARSQTEVA